jgi:hypothetical protein
VELPEILATIKISYAYYIDELTRTLKDLMALSLFRKQLWQPLPD